jgi:putative ABC transport system permease protein
VRSVVPASVRWTGGLCRRRPWVVAGASVSVALAVAFVASLGAFESASRASLTERAAKSVAVDWQVQDTPQGTAKEVATALAHVPGVRAVLPVAYARVPALTGSTPTGTRTTGAAEIVSIPANYVARAPGEIRFLVGSKHGVFLQQQTASNLGAVPGSVISVQSATGKHVALRVNGIVDLPKADSFFQVVGTASGVGATAPPDNVVIVPPSQFGALTAGSTVVHQFHVTLDHSTLPTDPSAAMTEVTGRANHFAAAVAGGALVGDNLSASLSGARQDAIYAQLLFLLLGLPGLALATVVAVLVIGLRSDRRRREVGLLFLRGASLRTVVGIVIGETVVTAIVGIGLGIPLSLLAVRAALGSHTSVPLSWILGASLVGLALAATTQLVPVLKAASRFRVEPVTSAVTRVPSTRQPWPLRAGLDAILLGAAAIVTVFAARGGYHVVVVPEGVPVASVNYAALLGPALAWPGLVLLAWRATAFVLSRLTGNLAAKRVGSAPELVAATLRRRRQIIARGAAGLAAALGLGASTAIFTATYDQQSHLDVALTVGADVAVSPAPGTSPVHSPPGALRTAPAVAGVEPLVHRFAYVGPDLQDMFGIRPQTIAQVASLQNSFVPGSSIAEVMRRLASTTDGVLLSAETLRDYQLHVGDLVRLRLPVGPSGTYQAVHFHVVGQVSEFPTAPKDSFMVANATYINRVTGADPVATFLVRSSSPGVTGAYLRAHLSPSWHVADIVGARSSVTTASGLAATDLGGLARLELAFTVVFAFACSGLALALGIAERRRGLVLLAALGATARQRGRFLGAEGRALLTGGVVGGAVVGGVIGYMLVKVLTGIFDPPPEGLVVPGGYLLALILTVVVVGLAVVAAAGRLVGRADPSHLRDL